MKISRTSLKNAFVETIALLYILLFVYAAVSKLLDFKNFQVQLGQSPLLSPFANYIAWIVPVCELLIAFLIMIRKTRLIGLFSAYLLMVMFTAYIFVILNYTAFIPCSCGGILEKLGWTEHLIFNFIFILLAVTSLFYLSKTEQKYPPAISKSGSRLIFWSATLLGICSIVVLFLWSENIVHYHNRLTRRFPHTPAHRTANIDLKLHSYYIAGANGSYIYLGNTTAPLLLTIFNTRLQLTQKRLITLDKNDFSYRDLRIIVKDNYFYVVDGTVPCIYKGSVEDWKATLIQKGGEYFGKATAIDSISLVLRTHNAFSGESILGVINTSTGKTTLNKEILQRQFDGVFDVDGQLHYSSGLNRIVYLYAYRNQFTLADTALKIDYRGTTIDTIEKADLKVVKVESHHVRKFAKPPLFVNKASSVYGAYLYVDSAVPGHFEDDKLWKSSSIIDVYNLSDNSYVFSFCIYDIAGEKVREFVVYDNHLFALVGSYLLYSPLNKKIMDKYLR